jgi:hypothetical protein
MTTVAVVYGLFDPTTHELRYVGLTVDLARRVAQHIRSAQQTRTYCARWIKNVIGHGLLPEVEVLEETDVERGPEQERFWISYFRFIGASLTNHTLGGEGVLGLRWTEERRVKQMAALADQFPPGAPCPEHLRRNLKLGWGNKSALGKRQSPESQAKRSTSLLRFYSEHVVVRSAEHNAKISAAKRGKVHAADCRHCVSVRRKEI